MKTIIPAAICLLWIYVQVEIFGKTHGENFSQESPTLTTRNINSSSTTRSRLIAPKTAIHLKNSSLEKASNLKENINQKNTSSSSPHHDQKEEEEFLCAIKKETFHFPFSKNSTISSYSLKEDFSSKIAFIRDPICPKDFHSVVRFFYHNNKWHHQTFIDCRNTNSAELNIFMGYQNKLIPVEKKSGEINLSILGHGFFLTLCEDAQLVATRVGKFTLKGSNHLIDSFGCTLLSKQMNPAELQNENFEIINRTCFNEKNCVAIAAKEHLLGLKVSHISKNRILVKTHLKNLRNLNLHPDTEVINNHLEFLEGPEINLAGFSDSTFTSLEEISCE